MQHSALITPPAFQLCPQSAIFGLVKHGILHVDLYLSAVSFRPIGFFVSPNGVKHILNQLSDDHLWLITVCHILFELHHLVSDIKSFFSHSPFFDSHDGFAVFVKHCRIFEGSIYRCLNHLYV